MNDEMNPHQHTALSSVVFLIQENKRLERENSLLKKKLVAVLEHTAA